MPILMWKMEEGYSTEFYVNKYAETLYVFSDADFAVWPITADHLSLGGFHKNIGIKIVNEMEKHIRQQDIKTLYVGVSNEWQYYNHDTGGYPYAVRNLKQTAASALLFYEMIEECMFNKPPVIIPGSYSWARYERKPHVR